MAQPESTQPGHAVTVAPSTQPSGVRAVLADRPAVWLLLATFFYFNAYMWMLFLASWLVEHITHDTRLVQLAGFCLVSTMALGPIIGKYADAGNCARRRLIEAAVLSVVAAANAAMTAAVALDW